MSAFVLSIRRVADDPDATLLEVLNLEVDWLYLPRIGEIVHVGRALQLELPVTSVEHEEGGVAVCLGSQVLEELQVEHLALACSPPSRCPQAA